jgi:hypothetical protein
VPAPPPDASLDFDLRPGVGGYADAAREASVP